MRLCALLAFILCSLGADRLFADQQDAPFAACYGLQNSAKTSGFTVSANDKGVSFLCSANPGFTVALSAAATLGDGFIFAVVNSGVGTITIDPNGTEKIFFPGGGGPGGGSPTVLTLETFQSVLLTCDGTSWYVVSSVGFSAGFGGRTKVLAALATLTNADTGAAVLCGTGSYTVTLPANTTQGWSAYIANIGSGTTITVSAASATPIIINGAAGVLSFTMTTGQSAWIMNAGSGNYYVTGPYGGITGAIANTQIAYGNGTAITSDAGFYRSGTKAYLTGAAATGDVTRWLITNTTADASADVALINNTGTNYLQWSLGGTTLAGSSGGINYAGNAVARCGTTAMLFSTGSGGVAAEADPVYMIPHDVTVARFNEVHGLTLYPLSAAAGATGLLEARELTANGTNIVAIKAPDALAADTTYTLPNAFGTTGDVLSATSAGVMSWATPITQTSGTFTPAIAGSSVAGTQTYAANGQKGYYRRNGNVVTVQIYLEMTALDGATAGNATITGLPFTGDTATNNTACFAFGTIANVTLSGGAFSVTGISVGSTIIGIRQQVSAGPEIALPVTGLSATTKLVLSGTYEL